MKCRICGAELKDNSKFCENCGAKVEDNTAGTETFERVDGEVVSEHHFRQNNEGQSEYTTETNSANTSYSETANQSYAGNSQSQSTGSYSNAGTQNTTRSYANTNASANDKDKYFAIGSLVCGILSIICCCCCIPFVNFILGGAAVGLGVYVLNKNLPGREMAIAGIVCGGIGLFIFVIGLIAGATDALSGLTNGIDVDDIEDFIESL